jgi:tRNA U54 and U55 pseudouridine synthase Pus10
MSFQSTFRSYLLADPTLYALVGERIYPVVLPQNATLPAVVYFRQGGRTDHKGIVKMTGRTRNFTIQIQAIGRNYDEADSVEEAIYDRLDQEVTGLSCRPLGETQDLYDEETKEFITASDYSCWYTPA